MTARLVDTPVLETERLVLRAPEIGDYPVCEAFTLSDRARFILGEPGTRRVAWRAFAHVTGMWALRGFGPFIFCDRRSGATLGLAGAWYPITWPEPEISWSVWAPEAEGRGYAHEAAKAARAWAFRTLGWQTAVSYIDPQNARSIALAERLGATPDTEARLAEGDTPENTVVYRHPAPEAAS